MTASARALPPLVSSNVPVRPIGHQSPLEIQCDLGGSWVEEYRVDNTPGQFLKPSPFERLFNRLFGVLVGWGVGLPHNYLVQVQGRKSGRIYSTPVDVLDYKGKRFLVAPRGETQWVRNAHVSGEVWLKRGRSRQRYALRTLDDREKPEILKEYLNCYKTTVQRYFSVPASGPLEAFSGIAPRYPVFELSAK
jgi:deazaflavin-dependent oxidoreductase (nitroreductase family)